MVLPFYLFTFRLWFLKAVFSNNRPTTRRQRDGTIHAAGQIGWCFPRVFVWNPICYDIHSSPMKYALHYCFLRRFFSRPLVSVWTWFYFWRYTNSHKLNWTDIVLANRNLNIWIGLLHCKTQTFFSFDTDSFFFFFIHSYWRNSILLRNITYFQDFHGINFSCQPNPRFMHVKLYIRDTKRRNTKLHASFLRYRKCIFIKKKMRASNVYFMEKNVWLVECDIL